MSSTRIRTNGIHLNVVQDGPEDGPLVLLLHGFPEFWYSWRRQIPFLAARGFRVWAPDLRGYNESDRPKDVSAYALAELARDVVGLIDASGRDKVHLVGHDWGGGLAWWIGIHHPERLHRLVVMNAPHPGVFEQHLRSSASQLRKSWYMFFFQLPLLPEWWFLRGGDRESVAATFQSSRPGAFTEEDLDRYLEAWSKPGAPAAMIHWYRASFRRRPELPRNARVKVPTLLIWGVDDIALERELAQPSIDRCDDGRLVVIEEATHWVHHDAPERVNAALAEFLPKP